MIKQITSGVEVSVQVKYEDFYSNPVKSYYLFSYTITLENKNSHPVQLLRREWDIYDVGSPRKNIKGDGVIGRQPTILPGKSHSYTSACNLASGLGKMSGKYVFVNKATGEEFDVLIPEFMLVTPDRLN